MSQLARGTISQRSKDQLCTTTWTDLQAQDGSLFVIDRFGKPLDSLNIQIMEVAGQGGCRFKLFASVDQVNWLDITGHEEIAGTDVTNSGIKGDLAPNGVEYIILTQALDSEWLSFPYYKMQVQSTRTDPNRQGKARAIAVGL